MVMNPAKGTGCGVGFLIGDLLRIGIIMQVDTGSLALDCLHNNVYRIRYEFKPHVSRYNYHPEDQGKVYVGLPCKICVEPVENVGATFKMIKQGLHDERLTRSCSCIRAEKAVQGRVLGLA